MVLLENTSNKTNINGMTKSEVLYDLSKTFIIAGYEPGNVIEVANRTYNDMFMTGLIKEETVNDQNICVSANE